MEHVLKRPKWLFMSLATAAGSLNGLCCGMQFGWTSPSLIKLKAKDSPVPVTADQGSWIAVSIFFGIFIGALLWNVLSHRLGKRLVGLVASGPFVLSWLMIAYAKSYHIIILARVLAGISDSLVFCSVPLFLAEISSSALRGFVMTFFPLLGALGSFMANLLGSYASIQTTALISSIFPLLSLALFLFIPDSPYDLIQQNRIEDAKNSLQLFQGVDDVDADLTRITNAIEEQISTNTGSYLDLITVPNFRKASLTLFGVRTTSQLSGITTIHVYAQSIFLNIDGNGDTFAVTFSSIFFLMPIAFSFVSLFLVDYVGRKPLMLLATIIITFALITLATVCYLKDADRIEHKIFVTVSSAALLVYVAVFSLGLQSAPLILVGEIFPAHLKSFASTVHECYFCFLSITSTKLFQVTSERFGMQIPFTIFAICTFCGTFFIIFCVPETRSRNLEEIQGLLKNEDEGNTSYGTRIES
ncbi:hypothetical protein FQR65_LT01319 [Abscondita terminalis]|nr:hypothetical protein FQR65_LT01319 [Abscondita terminalis]